MKRLGKFSILLLIIPVLLVSSEKTKARPLGRNLNMVTGMEIICQQGDATICRQYVQPHKISAVLTYLRLLDCGSAANSDPEQLQGSSIQIVLYDSSGPCSIYRQRANRYFSKDSGPWKQIPPEQGGMLYPLILSLPSDK